MKTRSMAALASFLLLLPACSVTDDATTTEATTSAIADVETDAAAADSDCATAAAQFSAELGANPDLADPEVSATCTGDLMVVESNAMPDYTYIQTTPGTPGPQDISYEIPASPTPASAKEPIPYVGPIGVTLAGVPIFGPTEGTGGDVLSFGAISECGSHNGPSGLHLHFLGTSEVTDCDFSPEEVESGPQLLGYAFDGYPIYTGNDQYTPSWELTDESLFATDTWEAHTYVEGSGDLDECNGLTDDDGSYAYYTTDAFPYVMGCFNGEFDLESNGPPARAEGEERPAPPGGGQGDRPARPEGEDGQPPARPDGEDGQPPARPTDDDQ